MVFMSRILIISSILLTTVSFCNNRNSSRESGQASIPKDSLALYGDWKITKFTAGSISEITEEDAQKYVGQIITLKAGLAVINSDTCNQPYFKTSIQSSDKYFYENNRVDKATLKIKQDSIQVVEIGCKNRPKYSNENSPNFLYDFIVIDNNLMIVSFKGFYFYLERVMKAF
jgi:hypothetical protein